MAEYNSMTETKIPSTSSDFNLLGDMTILREIIMGPQIMANNSRFSVMQADLIQKNEAFEKRIAASEKIFEAHIKKIESHFQEQLTEMRVSFEKLRLEDRKILSEAVVAIGTAIK